MSDGEATPGGGQVRVDTDAIATHQDQLNRRSEEPPRKAATSGDRRPGRAR
ncbi:hypothetical protein [Micromonospora polyrhachis]|uniref:Uncharacterized protein n=1 Tax=Micromonospora polyrhachis TaxID=1282883 RepID=A0A7W7WP73_9ACTN|nr:hypothetical protein [Micromonospora polyrhachis]MBB4958354.1 hypothetical protein [Micromonospora polyrhachis]